MATPESPHPPVVSGAVGTFMLKLVVQAVLVEGVLAEEVDSRERETTLAQTALHHLEHLGTAEGRGKRGGRCKGKGRVEEKVECNQWEGGRNGTGQQRRERKDERGRGYR